MLARTQWHRVSPTRLRRCLKCGKTYPSTSSWDRRCPNCVRQTQSSQARAALTMKNREILDYLDENFDMSMVVKADLARRFDYRKRARVNLLRVARLGLGRSWWSEKMLEQAADLNIFSEKVPYDDENAARERRESLARQASVDEGHDDPGDEP